MKGKMGRIAAIAALLALAGAADAGAQAGEPGGIAAYDYENLRLRGGGGEVFAVYASEVDATIGFGGRLDLGFLGPKVRTQLRAAFWNSELKDEEVARFEGRIADLVEEQNGTRPVIDLGSIDRRAVILGGDFHWMPAPASVARPYLGLGVELYVLSGSGDAIEDTFVDESLDVLTAGGSAMAGLEVDIGPVVTVFAEARGSLAADIQSFALVGGVTLLRR